MAAQRPRPLCYVLTGVSGSGKSTVGRLLAARLGCRFHDGDDFHPQSNIDKMRRGEALSDEDRLPWLQTLAALLGQHLARAEPCVLACSCLKRSYRQVLCGACAAGEGAPERPVAFVLLRPSREELLRRVGLRGREGSHFMPASLLDSQLETLEADPDSLVYVAPPCCLRCS